MAGAVSQIVAAARKRRDAGAEVRGLERGGWVMIQLVRLCVNVDV